MKNQKYKNLVLSALFAALVFVATRFLSFVIPGGGYAHPGDAMIYLCAAFVPVPYAVTAAALGAGLSDLTAGGYMLWIPGTIVIKAAMASLFTHKNARVVCLRNVIASVGAGCVCVGGYFLYEWLVVYGLLTKAPSPDGALASAALGIPYNAAQALVSALIFILLGAALDKVKLKNKI